MIIVADANERSVLWYSNKTVTREEMLEDSIHEQQLDVISGPNNPFTFQNRVRAKSNTCLTVCGRIAGWTVV